LGIIILLSLGKRVEADLQRTNSKLKGVLEEDWHTRVANLLLKPFKDKTQALMEKIASLEIVPLQNNH